jgi:hypothetical protein
MAKTADILSQLTEPQKANLPEPYKHYLSEIQSEVERIQASMEPSEEELSLINQISKD